MYRKLFTQMKNSNWQTFFFYPDSLDKISFATLRKNFLSPRNGKTFSNTIVGLTKQKKNDVSQQETN